MCVIVHEMARKIKKIAKNKKKVPAWRSEKSPTTLKRKVFSSKYHEPQWKFYEKR